MQKTVYVKDQAEWDEIKKRAEDSGQTVSRYLLGGVSQLDRIEKKLDQLLCGKAFVVSSGEINEKLEIEPGKILPVEKPKTIREKKIESSKGKDLSPKISKADEQMLKEKMDVIKKRRPESLTGFQGGYSKSQQLGKKK